MPFCRRYLKIKRIRQAIYRIEDKGNIERLFNGLIVNTHRPQRFNVFRPNFSRRER